MTVQDGSARTTGVPPPAGTFQSSPLSEDALILMARSYQALEMPDLQADAERVISLNFPDSRYLRGKK